MSTVQKTVSRLQALRKQVQSAAEDGKITRSERKAVKAAATRLDRFADSLARPRALPVEKAAAEIARALPKQRLAQRAPDLLAALGHSIERTREVARNLRPAAEVLGEKWQPVFKGVHKRPLRQKGVRGHLVAIDLAKAGVSLQTNGADRRGKTVPAQAQKHKAEVGINGDFFSFGSYLPSGLAMTRGKQWKGTSNWEPYLAFNGQRAQVLPGGAKVPDWAKNVVSGRPALVQGGRQVDRSTLGADSPQPRTAVGLSKNGRFLYLAVVDGRSQKSKGMTLHGVGRLMKRLGAHEAIALDGGGSSTMYVKGRGVVNRPSDGAPRSVANALLIQAKPR